MKGLTDFFLLCFFLLFSPLSLHLNGPPHLKFTPSTIIPFSLLLSFTLMPILTTSNLLLLLLSPYHLITVHTLLISSPHRSCVPVTLPSALTHSFMVTAVHSPVPYCGAVHHLHAISVLQQNEFLIGPNRRERSRKRR